MFGTRLHPCVGGACFVVHCLLLLLTEKKKKKVKKIVEGYVQTMEYIIVVRNTVRYFYRSYIISHGFSVSVLCWCCKVVTEWPYIKAFSLHFISSVHICFAVPLE